LFTNAIAMEKYRENCTFEDMPESKPHVHNVLKILFFCALGGTAMTYFTCMECRSSVTTYVHVALFSSFAWFVLWMGNGRIGNYIGKRIPWVDFPVRRLLIGIVTTVAYSATAILVLLWSWEFLFKFYFGNYSAIVVYSLGITFFISLILHSRAFLISWKQSAINAEKFQKESIKAQYDSLKNQVNPHFLFNSLNALTNLVYEDQDKAAKFIKRLSEVYRYVLETQDKEVIPLDEELKFLRSYIFLQEIRFDNNLKIEIELANNPGKVAPLALQLLVENAIKHNIVSVEDRLMIRIYEANGYIVVENNLQKKSSLDENLSGLGLENIRKRYGFLTDKKVIVEEGNGKFIVKLPVLELNRE